MERISSSGSSKTARWEVDWHSIQRTGTRVRTEASLGYNMFWRFQGLQSRGLFVAVVHDSGAEGSLSETQRDGGEESVAGVNLRIVPSSV